MIPKAKFSTVETLSEFHRRALSWLKIMALGGSALAPVAALLYCSKHKISVPKWVRDLASTSCCDLLNPTSPKRIGRSGNPVARYFQDMKDYRRHQAYELIREKQTEIPEYIRELLALPNPPKAIIEEQRKFEKWVGTTAERAYECAAMLLQGTSAFCGPDGIKAAHLRVKRNSKAGTLRYHQFDSEFLRSIGIEDPLQPFRATKVVPLYDLTL